MSNHAPTQSHRCLIKYLLHSNSTLCNLQHAFLLDTSSSHTRQDRPYSHTIPNLKQRLRQCKCAFNPRFFLHWNLDHWFPNPNCICTLWIWMYPSCNEVLELFRWNQMYRSVFLTNYSCILHLFQSLLLADTFEINSLLANANIDFHTLFGLSSRFL